MTDLIACLSTGKGTWGHVKRVIEEEQWENVYVVTNQFGADKFAAGKEFTKIIIDPMLSINDMSRQIQASLKDNVKGTEVAINLISGSGKEHMALVSAIMKMGLGFRLIALTKEGITEV